MNQINLRTIDLNLLVALDVLLEECHITKSASRLNLSQSAMSHILNRLRGTFNDELLIRVSNGYQKTSRAVQLEEPLKEALNRINMLLEENEFDPSTYEGEFSISTLDYGEVIAIPNFMKSVIKEAPKAKINIIHRKFVSRKSIVEQDADLVFGAILRETPKNCHVQPLFEDRYVCVMDAEHPLANSELSLENYLKYPHSIIQPGIVEETPIDRALRKKGLSRKIAKHSSHFMASVLVMKGTNLLQAMPKRMADQIKGTYNLVEKELPIHLEPIKFAQMWHTKNNNNKIHQWFRKKVEEAIQ